MIIATAGHIDHGKTKLVEAITGINSDRLPDEKIRVAVFGDFNRKTKPGN